MNTLDARPAAAPSDGEGRDVAVPLAAFEGAAARLAGVDAAALATGARLDVVARTLAAVDRVMAGVVGLVGAAQSDPATLREAGLTVPAWLRALAGCTHGDAATLTLAAERLAHMPSTRALFVSGRLSWAVVRGIVWSSARLNHEQLTWLDDTLAGDPQRLGRLDPDEVVGAVGELVDRVRPDLAKARADRAYEGQFLRVQLGLLGTSAIYAELDAESTAVVVSLSSLLCKWLWLGSSDVGLEAVGVCDE